MTTAEMELALVRYFNPRVSLIVPNVSWGMNLHECDLLILTKAGYLYEIEIKTSIYDLVRDKKKIHGHRNHKIKYLYFAITDGMGLASAEYHIPDRAGIIICRSIQPRPPSADPIVVCVEKRKPKAVSSYKLSWEERYQLARLGALRIWSLKDKLQNHDRP